MSKRAALYARVSGDDRGKDGRNLKGQLDMCREYALSKGYTVVAELAEDDRGASGASFELPQLNKGREMAHAGEIDVLVTREIDRLSRKLAKQLVVEEEFKRAGAELDYVLGDYPDTPEGRLNKHLRATIAEFEREKIMERMVRGRQLYVETGNVLVADRPPYGYRVVEREGKRTLEIYEPEAAVVRLIFTWYIEGDGENGPMTLGDIARKLTELQIPTYTDTHDCGLKGRRKRKESKWSRSFVIKVLGNETYAGAWHYGKYPRLNGRQVHSSEAVLAAVEVPAVISRETWEAAQARRAHNKRNVRRKAHYEYLLGGRLVCGVCGLKVQCTVGRYGDKVYLYYYCPTRCNFDCVRECDLPCFRADLVDAATWEWVKSFLSDPAALTKGLAEHQAGRDKENEPLRERLKVVDDLLADNEAQLERLLDLYLAGDFPKEMLTERKTRLEATIAALEREREALAAQIAERTLTQEQVQSLQEFASRVAEGLDAADADFATRRGIIEDLDVWVTLAVEDGQKVVYARCIFGDNCLPVVHSNG
jgi:site-specific DNA recombinase